MHTTDNLTNTPYVVIELKALICSVNKNISVSQFTTSNFIYPQCQKVLTRIPTSNSTKNTRKN